MENVIGGYRHKSFYTVKVTENLIKPSALLGEVHLPNSFGTITHRAKRLPVHVNAVQ